MICDLVLLCVCDLMGWLLILLVVCFLTLDCVCFGCACFTAVGWFTLIVLALSLLVFRCCLWWFAYSVLVVVLGVGVSIGIVVLICLFALLVGVVLVLFGCS